MTADQTSKRMTVDITSLTSYYLRQFNINFDINSIMDLLDMWDFDVFQACSRARGCVCV